MITFKQIQLVGFKSFADKTTIQLGDGVTCIVGPNGCGKSNVADAIRWVLGEQSAKMMRGSQMMDVIFNGTESRGKMGFCEVTLTFDNSNRLFDVDSAEVEMTRRLYRDGTSEYLLNRQPSRMKVLTGLLHSVGAAKEGYSIIGQGRIEQIMNAKPEDRRSIFEEATGIVVFKEKKSEAERRLEGAKDNLFVFLQRMQEVERQLGPLKKSAENALKYRELYAEQRRHETNLYIHRHDTAEGEKNAIFAKKKTVDDRNEYLLNFQNELVEEYEQCRDGIGKADEELQDLNDRIGRYAVGIEHKSGESRLFTERARAVKDRLSQAEEEISYSTKRIEALEKDIMRNLALGEKSDDRIKKMEVSAEEYRAKIATLSKSISEHDIATSEHRKKVLETYRDLSELSKNIGSLSAQKELLSERIAEIESDMLKIRTRHDDSRAEYQTCIARSDKLTDLLGNEDSLISGSETRLKEVEDKLNSLIRQIYDAQASIISLNRNLEEFRGIRDRFQGYIGSVQKLMSDAKGNLELAARIKGLIADVVSCDEQYEVAIETAFGGAMQNVITSTREDARELIEYLKRNRAGQVTFLPIEALRPIYEDGQIKMAVHERGAIGYAIDLVKYDKKFENVIHNLLGNTLIVDDIYNATQIAKRFPRAFKIVTLEGDVITTRGSMTGGSRRGNAGNLLAHERAIKEFEEGIEAKKSFLSRAEGRKTELEEAKKAATEEFTALQKKLQDARLELASVTERQTALLQVISGAEQEYAAYNESYNAFKRRLAELEGEYTGASQGASDLSVLSDKTALEIDDMSAEYDKLVAEREELSERLNSTLIETASLASAVTSYKDAAARLEKEKVELQEKIKKITANLPEMRDELASLTAQAESTALTKEEQAVVGNLRKQIEKITQKKADLNERIKQIDIGRLSIAEERDSLTVRSHNYEMALAKIDSDLEVLRQRIADEYGLQYEDCLQYKEEGYDASTANAAIANCKRQITLLGQVNHGAVEEYEELNARYEGMVAERDDLEKAIEDLTTALNDIRNEMLRIFNEGFDIINENFKRTFKELFGGGKAELQLDYTDCDDPLNAGVEIVACPPGKKLSKISLLSGGERALTAIAILFAIIGMRPMPFCVLDEIEAALDEANVARYAKYLKKFASHTQFIVITHRKPTMENADILFGVTMQEKGVSKVVSVKLSEVEERLGGDTIE